MNKAKKDHLINLLKRIQDSIDDQDTNVRLDCVMATIIYDKEELKWVPISKAVPKEPGEYLTTTLHGSVYCDHWNGEYFERTETVIAWMKLPAPYKWEDAK